MSEMTGELFAGRNNNKSAPAKSQCFQFSDADPGSAASSSHLYDLASSRKELLDVSRQPAVPSQAFVHLSTHHSGGGVHYAQLSPDRVLSTHY